VPIQGLSFANLLEPVPLGIAAGLFIGKQLGVFGFIWVSVKLGLAKNGLFTQLGNAVRHGHFMRHWLYHELIRWVFVFRCKPC